MTAAARHWRRYWWSAVVFSILVWCCAYSAGVSCLAYREAETIYLQYYNQGHWYRQQFALDQGRFSYADARSVAAAAGGGQLVWQSGHIQLSLFPLHSATLAQALERLRMKQQDWTLRIDRWHLAALLCLSLAAGCWWRLWRWMRAGATA